MLLTFNLPLLGSGVWILIIFHVDGIIEHFIPSLFLC